MTVMADGMIGAIEIKVVDGIKIRMVGETEELVLVRDPDQGKGNEASVVGETEGSIDIIYKIHKSIYLVIQLNAV